MADTLKLNLLNNDSVTSMRIPVMILGLFFVIYAIISIIASDAGLQCQQMCRSTIRSRGFLQFNFGMTTIVGSIGLSMIIFGYIYPLYWIA